MKQALLSIALLFSLPLICQKADTVEYKKFRIGLVFSPDYCYRLLNYHSSAQWIEELRNKEEVPLFGFTTGLGLRIDLKGKFVLETGVHYSIKGTQTKYAELVWATPNPDYAVKSKTQYEFKYIDIPIKVLYPFGSKKLKCFVSAGVSINIFSEKKTEVILGYTNGETTSENSVVDLGYLKFNVAALIGFGIKYDATKRISISVEPIYRQFINSISADTKIKEYHYSLGANVGVYYSLKKKK